MGVLVERWTTEQIIIMIRQSIVLATVITISYSQSQYSHHSQFNEGGRRRFARRVVTGLEPSDRNNLGDDDRSSRREFSPIFGGLSDFNSPYLMIDSNKFTVLPAVPNLINHRSQKSLNSNNNQNFLFPSSSNLKPIPAVPTQKTSTKKPKRVQTPTISSQIPVTPPPPSPPPPPPPPSSPSETVRKPTNPSSDREERKKFKKCHGRCVQKFCLPVGTLAKHQTCQDSCRSICTL